MRLIYITALLFFSSLVYSQSMQGVIMCDTLTGEKILVETVGLVDDCCYEWDGINWAKRANCDNVGECVEKSVECVESQEWTYAIDNTGTQTNFNAELEITLSDGSSFIVQQTDQGATSQWTPQMGEWGANIQQAADDAGIAWFVETRFIYSNSSDLSGGGGFNGPPSEAISKALYEGGMRARYVNIQICPGQPVPTNAVFRGIDNTDPRYDEVVMTTAGAVLGELNKFFVCRACGKEPVWYLDDGITLASSGQIPNCYEPCGTLALTESPPDRACSFEFDLGCDGDATAIVQNAVTRRSTICEGEPVIFDYFITDSNDPSSSIEYDIQVGFVDCDTREDVISPVPSCEFFEITTLYKTENITGTLENREWHNTFTVAATADQTTEFGQKVRLNHDESLAASTASTVTGLSVDDTDSTAGEGDIQIVEGYISVSPEFSGLYRYSANSEGYIAVEMGLCCGNVTLIDELGKGVGFGSVEFEIPQGRHYIKVWNIDSGGANSNWEFQKYENGVWVNANTLLDVSEEKPYETCTQIKVCEETETYIGLIDGNTIDITDYYDCTTTCTDNRVIPYVVNSAATCINDVQYTIWYYSDGTTTETEYTGNADNWCTCDDNGN